MPEFVHQRIENGKTVTFSWLGDDITFRRLVQPDEYLDRLVWGHTDPKAPMLLEKALDIENKMISG